MPPFRLWILTAAVLLFYSNAPSQKIFFEQLSTAEGLPSDYVNCVFEDSKGYLWIGTDKGACRYDGREFQYFNSDNGLLSNFVSCFAEDALGNIWIGTINSGVCKYDGKNLTPFAVAGNENENILKVHFNDDNSFFILSRPQEVGGQGPIVLYFFKDEKSLPQKFPNMAFLKMLRPGQFITGSTKQLFVIQVKDRQPHFYKLPHPKADNNPFLYWLCDDRVIALKKNSVLEFNTDGERWTVAKEFSTARFTFLPDWTVIKNILINNNELFIATANGLFHIDNNGKADIFKAENGLDVNYVQSIYKDRRNRIYICTYGAGIKIWPVRYLEEYKTNGKVTSLFASGGITYITTTKNVYKFNPPSQFYGFQNSTTGSFTSFYKDLRGDVYLGTLNNYYKLPAEKFTGVNNAIDKAIPFKANSGTSGFMEFNKNIYVSTYGDGMYVFDGKNKNADTLHESTTPPASLIVEFLVPLQSSFAALTYNSGLTIYDSSGEHTRLTKSEGLLSNTVYAVFQEKENEIWIGTQNGLNLFGNNRVTKTFTSKDGLSGTKVVTIFRDAMQRFWVLSDKFLHLLQNDHLRAIRSHTLLYNEKNSINRAFYNPEINTLFIGLTDALLTVNMDRIIPDTLVDIPKLDAVRRDSAILSADPGGLLSLSSSSSNIVFQFDHKYAIGHRSDLLYKLSGFDEDWKLLLNAAEIVYPKLPAGDYKLIAKTINPDGYESAEYELLKLEVLPPFWKRTWFITFVAVFMLAIFFYIGNVISRVRYNRKIRDLQEEYRLQLERERIARELHDNVGSQLTYLINKIDDDYPKLAVKDEAEKLSGVARGAMQELRETIWALDKKEVQWDDLHNKVRQLTRLYKTENHIVELDWQVNSAPALNPIEALNIYRIIQEALNNAEKYSDASIVKVAVSYRDDGIDVEICDNGNGFDMQKTDKGYGLNNIRKRAEEMNAYLRIESQPGSGTKVKMRL